MPVPVLVVVFLFLGGGVDQPTHSQVRVAQQLCSSGYSPSISGLGRYTYSIHQSMYFVCVFLACAVARFPFRAVPINEGDLPWFSKAASASRLVMVV